MSELSMYCLVRKDLVMPVGKAMAQAGHAFLKSALVAGFELLTEYDNTSLHRKITLVAKNEHALRRAQKECEQLNIPCYLVIDAGLTVFDGPTVTCLGIGPVLKENLPTFIQKMQLFSEW